MGSYLNTLNGSQASLTGFLSAQQAAGVASRTTAAGIAASSTSWDLFTASIWANTKAIAAWMVATPVGQIMLIAAAIYSLVKIIDAVHTSSEEWHEKLSEIQSEIVNLETEQSTLNTELENTQLRISEILNQGPLTLTQEEELKRLQSQNAELERQIALNETLINQKNLEQAKTFVETMKEDSKPKINWLSQFLAPFLPFGNIIAYSQTERPLNSDAAFSELQQLETEKATASLQEAEKIQKRIDVLKQKLAEQYEKYQSSADGATYFTGDNLTSIQKESNDFLDSINEFNDRYLLATDAAKNTTTVLKSIWTRDSFSGAHDAITELLEKGNLNNQSLIDLYNKNEQVNALVNYLNKLGLINIDFNKDGKLDAEELKDGIGEVITYVKMLKTEGAPAVKTFGDTLDGLKSSEEKIKAISNAFNELQQNGKLTASSLSGLYGMFESLPNLDEYMLKIAGASTVQETTDALKNLLTAYLYSSDALNTLTEENKEAIVVQLENMGVMNARTLVEQQLWANSLGLADASAAEAIELINLSNATNTARKALAAYALSKNMTKMAANNFKSITEDEVASLKTLASQANNSGKVLSLINQILNYSDKLDTVRASYADEDRDSWTNFYESLIRDSLSELNDLLFPLDIEFPGNEGNNGDDQNREAERKKQIASYFSNLEHRHNMGKLSEKQYLDELERLNNRYYRNSADFASEYQSNLERIRSGRLQLTRDNFAKEQKELQRQRDLGKLSEFNYLQKLENLNNRYYKNKKDFAEDYQQTLDEIMQGRMSLYQEAYDQLNALVDKQVEKIKSEKEAEKKVLQDKLNNLKEFYDKQKQMLRDQADEDQYEKEQAEKRKTVTELELEIQALSRSTSARDRKLLAEKQQELADAREELRDFENERALDEAEKAIDLQYEKDEERINKDIEKIDQYLENQYKIQQDALNELKQIKNFSKQSALYKEMRDWNRQNGTGKDADIDELFSNVAAINKAFGNGTFGGAMSYLQGQIKTTKRSFAGGTAGAPAGLALVDEQGYEVKLGNPSAGKYQFLNDGDIVFTRAESRFLKRLTGSGGASLIGERLAGLLRRGANALSPLTAAAMAGQAPVAIRTGDIVINGDANKRTIAQIKAAQKDMTYQILRQFQKLK